MAFFAAQMLGVFAFYIYFILCMYACRNIDGCISENVYFFINVHLDYVIKTKRYFIKCDIAFT